MTSVSRTAQFDKLSKVLKKRYKPVAMNAERTVMEHLLFACCLEDARYEAAEEAFAALVHTFFDWNEVRVTSISELSEVMASLPDPRTAANRIKRVLHAVFESRFNFDLEDTKKKNLGPTVKWLEDLDGTTRFTVAFVVQASLGGHSIPIDAGTMTVLKLLDLVGEKEAEKGEVPGLERAIPKSKGAEFGSLLHQFSADFTANPYAPAVKTLLLEVDPQVADRLPKRRAESSAKKTTENQPEESAKPAATSKKDSKKEQKKEGKEGKEKKEEKKEPKKHEPVGKSPTSKKSSVPEKTVEPAKKPKKKTSPELAAETPATSSRENASAKKKSVAEGLSKRKPR